MKDIPDFQIMQNKEERERRKIQEFEEAYEAKEIFLKIKNLIKQLPEEDRNIAEGYLNDFLKKSTAYYINLKRTETVKIHGELEKQLLELEKERRTIHQNLRNCLKNLASIFIKHKGEILQQWQNLIAEKDLTNNLKISLFALNLAHWQHLQETMNNTNSSKT